MINSISIDDYRYPDKIKKLEDAPETLYFSGDISILNYDITGVIGSRQVYDFEIKLAYDVGKSVAERNSVLVNGLAIGCDTSAIRGALDLNGKVIVTLPCGIDEIYPKCNTLLAQEILDKGGCILSEYKNGTQPARHRFIERDRLQAILSDRIIVISSEKKGGTMHTVSYSMQYDVPLGCISGSEGCQMLIDSKKALDVSNNLERLFEKAKETQMAFF